MRAGARSNAGSEPDARRLRAGIDKHGPASGLRDPGILPAEHFASGPEWAAEVSEVDMPRVPGRR